MGEFCRDGKASSCDPLMPLPLLSQKNVFLKMILILI